MWVHCLLNFYFHAFISKNFIKGAVKRVLTTYHLYQNSRSFKLYVRLSTT